LSKLAEFLVAEGVVDDISHEGLRVLLREEGVTFQRLKTWKTSKDPDYAAKKARIEHLYAIADGEVTPDDGEPEVIFCVDESGSLNPQPRPGRQWAAISGKNAEPGRAAGIRPKLRIVLADSGYASEENFTRADEDKLRLLAPLAKDPSRRTGRPPRRAIRDCAGSRLDSGYVLFGCGFRFLRHSDAQRAD
jgi:hypothetical protein